MTPSPNTESAVLTDEQIDVLNPYAHHNSSGTIWRNGFDAGARAALSTSREAGGEAAPRDETAWLIEWKSGSYGPQWWGFSHEPGKRGSWCEDVNKAIRFARREDAERMRVHVIAVDGLTGRCSYEESISATEHMWTTSNPPSPQPATTPSAEPEADPWALLSEIDTWACMLPTFEVIHEGGSKAAAANVVAAIRKASELLAATKQPTPSAEQIMFEVGRQMVELTTTVRGQDEWLCIPELWRMCMEERDRLRAELAATKQPAGEVQEAVAPIGFSPMWFAPLDGTPVLLYMPTCTEKFVVGQWHGSFNSIIGNWGDDEGNYYAHQPVSFMALRNLERVANPPPAIVGQDRGACVRQSEDGRWTMVAPTLPTGHNQVTCITYCETEDEADELLDYWNRGFKFAASQNASISPPPAAPAVPTDEIGRLLAQAMDTAVANGANSVSMPDDYVAIAAWLAAAPQQPKELGA